MSKIMNRTRLVVLMIAVVWLLSTARLLAADYSSNAFAGIGPGYFYLFPKDTQIQNYYSSGLTWKAFIGLKATNGLSAVLDLGYYTEGNRGSTAPPGTNLTITPITASLSYHFFQSGAISPYVGGGVGIYNINESDPDFNYLSTTKFGKHIYAGADVYFNPETFLRAELRQSFVDPANSALYYQANFGGFSAMVALAMEWPMYRPEPPMTPEERALENERKLREAEIRARISLLREMEDYYRRRDWDARAYERWQSHEHLLIEINKTKEEIERERAREEELKKQIEQKRQQYIEEKKELRKEKKESVVNPKK